MGFSKTLLAILLGLFVSVKLFVFVSFFFCTFGSWDDSRRVIMCPRRNYRQIKLGTKRIAAKFLLISDIYFT